MDREHMISLMMAAAVAFGIVSLTIADLTALVPGGAVLIIVVVVAALLIPEQ